jgi:hypothetical protein
MLYVKRKRFAAFFNFLILLGLLCMSVLGFAILLQHSLSPFWLSISIGILACSAAAIAFPAAMWVFEFDRTERLFLVGILTASLILYITML